MAEACLISIAESLLAKLGHYAFERIKLLWGARDDLQNLVSTIEFIKAGLLDAERRQNEGELIKTWLRRLRYVLYDADDLFDMVFTIEESKQILTRRGKLMGELSQFFSKSNHIVLRAEIARKVKKIREELDGIKSDMGHFDFNRNLVESSMCYDRESSPIKAADEVIGREQEEIELTRLLSDNTSKAGGSVDVIAIVGFGGLGKTALAQLLYNNKVVKENFDPRAWACMSDIEGKTEKARIILDALQTSDVVGSSDGSSNRIDVRGTRANKLDQEIQERVQKKKFFLVVDDYWDEDRNIWSDLMGLLSGGKAGSKILVTTRSRKVARVVGVISPHFIKGLTDEKAWELFKKLAFMSAIDAENQCLIMMGKEIVKKYKNVPLAIKAIASVLYTCCDDERKWRSIMDSDMLAWELAENLKILPVLKLSYDHLPSHLKQCFAFCSVFPKNFKMDGEKLIDYWISHGYVEQQSSTVQHGLMQIGESYLKELVARSFLQELQEDRRGKGRGRYGSYMMHDLMHDLAQVVAGEEVLCIQSSANRPGHIGENRQDYVSKNARIRHLSLFSNENRPTLNDVLQSEREKYLRSLILTYPWRSTIDFKVLSHLRLLDMASMGIENLCNSVGELKHLRCPILSRNNFIHLPESICTLHNLKILDVSRCRRLQTLPRDLNELINLTCLRVEECVSLRGMPCNLGEMSSLEFLDEFMIGESSSEHSRLEALAGLVNLGGERLVVQFLERGGGVARKNDGKKRVDLSSSLVHLDQLGIKWPDPSRRSDWADDFSCRRTEWDAEGVEFQCSKLPSNLKKLDIYFFQGQVIPEWKAFNSLQEVYLYDCTKCRYLPSFGEQPRLRVLVLRRLHELEYIQMEENDELAAETQSLVKLELFSLLKLKAWSPAMEKLAQRHISSSLIDAAAAFPRFHPLIDLEITDCYRLMSLPLLAKDKRYQGPSGSFEEPLKSIMKDNGNRPYYYHCC